MRLPDFFILGVQKAGTTTLADLLDATPGLTLTRPKEPMFFCCDDMEVQFTNLFRQPSSWARFDWPARRDELLTEYAQCYAHAAEDELIGDGSTTTLISERALQRIAETCPQAKHLVLLRDPVRRAYSAYWHSVRIGLNHEPFEAVLRGGRDCLLRFGLYEHHLRRLYRFVPQEQVLVLHFEDLTRDQPAIWKQAVEFLGCKADQLPLQASTHANPAFFPKSRWLHRQLAHFQGIHDDSAPPVTWIPPEERAKRTLALGSGKGRAKALYRQLLMSNRKPAENNPETVRTLRQFFRKENQGLPDLISRDVFTLWGWEA